MVSTEKEKLLRLGADVRHLLYRVRTKVMETWFYEVVSIDGDYANLRRTDIESNDLKLVARALLPAEILEGSKLKYELMQYELIG